MSIEKRGLNKFGETLDEEAERKAKENKTVDRSVDVSNPNHIAGASEVDTDDALDISIGKILTALELPSIQALASAHSKGRFNFPESLEEVLKNAGIDLKKTAENFLDFVGVPVSIQEIVGHFLVCGTTGSGKTTLIKYLMAQALHWVGYNRNQRAIVYDPKNELIPFLYATFSSPDDTKPKPKEIIKVLNPFDERCVRWNISKDIRTKTEAKRFASTVIPDDSKNPFFPKSAQLILADIIYAFILYAESIKKANKGKSESEQEPIPEWTLRDVCCAFHSVFLKTFDEQIGEIGDDFDALDSAIAEVILKRHPLTRRTIKFIKRGEAQNSNNDVLLTLLAYIDDLEAIAAAWDNREQISLRDWAIDKKGQILVLGRSAQNEEALNAINSAMIQFVRGIIIDGEESEQDIDIKPIDKGRTYLSDKSYEELVKEKFNPKQKEPDYPSRTWLFLDEFASLKIKNLDTFLTEGRSKGVCVILSFQNYASIQENYKKYIASVITSCCNFKVFLRSEGEAADWIAQEIGKERRFETSYGTNESTSEAFGDSDTTSSGYHSSSGSSPGGYSSSSGSSSGSSRTTSYTFTRTQGSSTTISVVEREIVMKGDITSLKPASKSNGLEGYVQFSGVAGKIWKFHYDWNYIRTRLEVEKNHRQKIKEHPESNIEPLPPKFISRLEKEGLEYLDLKPFEKKDFIRLGLSYDKYLELVKAKALEREFSQIKVSFERLQVFINKLDLQNGRMDARDSIFFGKLSDFDKKTVMDNLKKSNEII
jgi:hypothetical protein